MRDDPTRVQDHPAFEGISASSGKIAAGYAVNFVGQIIDLSFVQEVPDEVRDKILAKSLPEPNDEIVEWIAVLEAIREAKGWFTMVELGAGFGRWMMSAAKAAERLGLTLDFSFIAAEAEPRHMEFMRQHFRDNGFDPEAHRLFEGVVNGTGEPTYFTVGHPDEWYGQAIVPEGYVSQAYRQADTVLVGATTLDVLIGDIRYVDLVDMDIQGTEREVIEGSIEVLTKRVRRLFVGTHSPELHSSISSIMASAGWECVYSYGWDGPITETDFGPISFGDGAQYWINPKLDPNRRKRGFWTFW